MNLGRRPGASALALAACLLAAAPLAAAAGTPLAAPGDAALALPTGAQQHPAVAAGGLGSLVVWDDTRTAIGFSVNAAYEPLIGNQTDIYAMRLDAAGAPLDATPIVVCNLGRNQTRPRVAWNGENFLVVFVSERPDWYFFEDIVGVRVAPSGAVLDAEPIAIRPELNDPANYAGTNPYVTADGANWVVVWEDWNPANSHPNVKGTRIGPDGAVLDPGWPTLYEFGFPSFGPRDPRIEPGNGELLLLWREATGSPLSARRISPGLVPLAAPFTVTTVVAPYAPSLATNGTTWFALTGQKGYRIGAGGSVLDPAGIAIPMLGNTSNPQSAAAWNGSAFAVVTATVLVPGTSQDLQLVRVAPGGALLDPTPLVIAAAPGDESAPAVSGAGGRTQTAYQARTPAPVYGEDVRSTSVAANGALAPAQDASRGRARQEWVDVATASGAHYAVYVSRTSTTARILGQRFDAEGVALDAEPVQLHSGPASNNYRPSCAWNGSVLCVGFVDAALGVVVRRFDAGLAPLDAAPVQLFAAGTAVAVGARNASGGDFFAASTYLVSGDLSFLRGVRVRATDGAVLDPAPLAVGGNFVEQVEVTGLGDRWLTVWSRRPTHDSPASAIRARFLDVAGVQSAELQVSQAGYGFAPDVAVLGDRALVVYDDNESYANDVIQGRLLRADGTFPAGEFLIADAPIRQAFPTAAADGAHFVAAWTDFRDQLDIEALRGDVYAARVTVNGDVLDPNGVQLTAGELPDDLPCAAGLGGRTLVLYSGFGAGGQPVDVQRIALVRADQRLPSAWQDLGLGKQGSAGVPQLTGAGDFLPDTPVVVALAHAAPASVAWLFAGAARVDLPFLGGTLVPTPTLAVPVPTGAAGGFQVAATWPAGAAGATLFLQAWVADAAAFAGASASNALRADAP